MTEYRSGQQLRHTAVESLHLLAMWPLASSGAFGLNPLFSFFY